MGIPVKIKGRGALSNPDSRFESIGRSSFDDGWDDFEHELRPVQTIVQADLARSIISRNDSADIPFEQSINPYRGCEHGCIYCYARPSHAYLGFSSGVDFETRILAKPNAAELLRKELRKPGYRCKVIAMGSNTDPYQPVEREWRITRQILEVLAEFKHPVSIVTKSALIERDIDLLATMASEQLASVFVSITTLDRELSRKMDPRAAAPHRRLETIRALNASGIPTGILVAPVIPALNDNHMEAVLDAAYDCGARRAGYALLRLPHDVKGLFTEWLTMHYPLKAEHVMSLLRQCRGGKDNDSDFGTRMRGVGIFAEIISKRFHIATRKLGYNQDAFALDETRFRPLATQDSQMSLF